MRFSDFPSLASNLLPSDLIGKTNYPTLPIDFFTDSEQEKIRTLVEKLIDPKDFDFSQCLTVTSETKMVIDGLLAPKVYRTGSGLALKMGNNFIDFVYDAKSKQWKTLSGTSLMLGNSHDEQNKVDYPVFQLDLGSELYTFPLAWEKPEVLAPVKNKLRSLLVPPQDTLQTYIKQYAVIPAPLYALLQAGTVQLSSQGMSQYRIVDISVATGKYPGYVIHLDPDHVPEIPLYDINGRSFSTTAFNAQNISKDIIDVHFQNLKDRLAAWKEAIKAIPSVVKDDAGKALVEKARSLETWLIMQGVIKLGNGKLSVKHTIFQGALPPMMQEFRPVLDPNYKILPPVPTSAPQLASVPNYDNNPL